MRRRASSFICGIVLAVSPALGALATSPAMAQQPAAAAIEPPKLLSDPDVPYPPGAEGEATITLTLLVGDDGSVRSATADGAGEPFASAAIERAKAWR